MLFRSLFIGLLFVVAAGEGMGQILIGDAGDPYASYLVIEAAAFTTQPMVFEIRYGDTDQPQDTYALLMTVLGAGVGLSGDFTNFGDEEEPNYFLGSLTYDGITLAGETLDTDPVSYLYWSQFISGGWSWDYDEWEPVSVPDNAWTYGGGISHPYRVVVPGSWDAFVYGDGSVDPSVAPIPEPSALCFLLLALGAVYGFRAWRAA